VIKSENILTANYLGKCSRDQIIAWLVKFDKDGCYTDSQRLAEGFEPFTKATALAKALNQLNEVGL
jgi:hypothetical protein